MLELQDILRGREGPNRRKFQQVDTKDGQSGPMGANHQASPSGPGLVCTGGAIGGLDEGNTDVAAYENCPANRVKLTSSLRLYSRTNVANSALVSRAETTKAVIAAGRSSIVYSAA